MLKFFLKQTPVTPEPTSDYSDILKQRLSHWKNHTQIKDPALREEIRRLRHYNDKSTALDFVRGLGIACPSFQQYSNAKEALKAHRNNPRFVLKPAAGHSSKGVHLLTRDADGSLHCHMSNKHFRKESELVQDYQSELATQDNPFAMSENVIVEDYLEDAQGYAVPLDYKVYAFQSGVALIMQKYGPSHVDKHQWVFNFFDRDGKPLGAIRKERPGERKTILQPPPSFADLVATAEKLVKAMQVSFLRMDLYLTPKGVVFGECTPLPNLGKKAFYDEYEQILGRQWQKSLKELGVDYNKA